MWENLPCEMSKNPIKIISNSGQMKQYVDHVSERLMNQYGHDNWLKQDPAKCYHKYK